MLALNKQLTETEPGAPPVRRDESRQEGPRAQAIEGPAAPGRVVRGPAARPRRSRSCSRAKAASLARDKLALTNGALNDALAELRERRTLVGHISGRSRPRSSARTGRAWSRRRAEGDIARLGRQRREEPLAVAVPPARRPRHVHSERPLPRDVFAGDGSARIWDARPGRKLARPPGDPDASDGNGGATTTRRADGAPSRCGTTSPESSRWA